MASPPASAPTNLRRCIIELPRRRLGYDRTTEAMSRSLMQCPLAGSASYHIVECGGLCTTAISLPKVRLGVHFRTSVRATATFALAPTADITNVAAMARAPHMLNRE